MGVFRKIGIGIKRAFESNNDRIDESKVFGNSGETFFYKELVSILPKDAIIKRNIVISTNGKSGEIDFLVVYQNKVFAIELKNWKGAITNNGDTFYQDKPDKYTYEVHHKEAKSPFRQIKRNIYNLKEQTTKRVFINPIIYFLNNSEVYLNCDDVWFNNMNGLYSYITREGSTSYPNDINYLLKKLVIADKIYGKYGMDHNITGFIREGAIRTDFGVDKRDIDYITFEHHFSSDDITVVLLNGSARSFNLENGYIFVEHDKKVDTFYYAKIDYIVIGH